jgi:Core-2/I-Branching enzyme
MIAVLIHAHKNRNQLYRLMQSLQHPEIKIFLHLDAKCGFTCHLPGVINIENPVTIEWASFSQVRALLHSLRFIESSGMEFDFIHFISGQDFPIKPVNEFVDYLNSNKGYSFVEAKKIPEDWPGAAIRYERYYFTDNKFFNKVTRPFLKLLSVFYKRKPPVKIYGGSQWVTISAEAFQYILQNEKALAAYRFLRLCNVADELFIQTVLMNSPLAEKCINNNLRFIRWANNGKAAANNPDILTIADFEKIKSSPQFFARKFDEERDPQILDKISNELL